jgi:hypothetical protein
MTRILTSDAVTGYRNGINEAHVQGGFTGGSDVRRGKSIIATTESRSSASYGLLDDARPRAERCPRRPTA